MRFLIFAAYYLPHRGGYESYINNLCSQLSANGHSVDLVTCNTNDAPEYEVINNINIFRLPCWEILNKTYVIPKPISTSNLLRRLSKNKYDFINTHTRFFTTSYTGLKFSKSNKTPLINIEHGSCHPVITNLFVRKFAELYDHTYGAAVIKNSIISAGVSKQVCEFTRHLGAKKTIVIPNCVDTKLFDTVKTNLKNDLRINEDIKIITFVGRLIYAKGVQDLISAVSDFKNIKLLIVGNGNYGTELEKIANKNVIFLGEKNTGEIAEILSATDIFVNPSYSEGMPTCVIEAGCAGIPIIATNVGGTGEIIDDKVNGFLFEPKDIHDLRQKLNALIKNPRLRKLFSDKIREKTRKEFGLDTMYGKFMEAINAK